MRVRHDTQIKCSRPPGSQCGSFEHVVFKVEQTGYNLARPNEGGVGCLLILSLFAVTAKGDELPVDLLRGQRVLDNVRSLRWTELRKVLL